MSKKDDIKEQIGMLKFWLGVLVATLLAIIGWAITNYESARGWLLIAAPVASVFILVLIVWILKMIDKNRKKLRKL